jgi:hypothetical protein
MRPHHWHLLTVAHQEGMLMEQVEKVCTSHVLQLIPVEGHRICIMLFHGHARAPDVAKCSWSCKGSRCSQVFMVMQGLQIGYPFKRSIPDVVLQLLRVSRLPELPIRSADRLFPRLGLDDIPQDLSCSLPGLMVPFDGPQVRT